MAATSLVFLMKSMKITDTDLPSWRTFYVVERIGSRWALRCPRCQKNFAMYCLPYRRTRDSRWALRKHAESHGIKIPATGWRGELVEVDRRKLGWRSP